MATERCFLADGRGLYADKRMMGGSRASFIAAMALYSTSIIVKLRRLEAARF